jgi:hypothetical protein
MGFDKTNPSATYAAAKDWLKANNANFRMVGDRVFLKANGRAVEFDLTLPHDDAVVLAVSRLQRSSS